MEPFFKDNLLTTKAILLHLNTLIYKVCKKNYLVSLIASLINVINSSLPGFSAIFVLKFGC